MAEWSDAVVRITSADPKNDSFGTGFVFHRDADGRSYLITCLHVVEAVGRDNGEVAAGLPMEILAEGDELLDLAVVAVDGLPAQTPELRLGPPGRPGLAFQTMGHTWFRKTEKTLVSRPLDGKLGQRIYFGSLSKRKSEIAAWDFTIEQPDEFAELKEGYSGAPVWDPTTRQVLGVISHRHGTDKGHALCIENHHHLKPSLPEIIPGFSAGKSTPADEYAADQGYEWLASTLDHGEQIRPVENRFGADEFATGRDRQFYLFEGCLDDCPSALAEHMGVELNGPPRSAADLLADTLDLNQYYGRDGFWHALVDKVCPAGADTGRLSREAQIYAWINRKRFTVLYAMVQMEKQRDQIPELVAGAVARMKALPPFNPGTRLLVLFGCIRQERKWTGRWPLRRKCPIPELERNDCELLGTLSPLTRYDMHAWVDTSRHLQDLAGRVDRERLRGALDPLFPSDATKVRYQVLRHKLIHNGTLRSAFKTP